MLALFLPTKLQLTIDNLKKIYKSNNVLMIKSLSIKNNNALIQNIEILKQVTTYSNDFMNFFK